MSQLSHQYPAGRELKGDGASAESRAWNHLDPQQGTVELLLCQTQSGFHGYGSIALKNQ